jgi:hypothetical protein
MNLYSNIFKNAWVITWKNKYLWFFGVFAVILGNGNEYDFPSLFNTLSEFIINLKEFFSTGIFRSDSISNIARAFVSEPVTFFIIMTILLIMLVLVIFLVWLVVISQIAIINNSAKIAGGKETNFKDAVEAGVKNFWPVLGLNFIQKMAVYLLIALLTIPALQMGAPLYVLFWPLVFIFFLISLGFSMLFRYALAFVVIKDKKIKEATIASWDLLKKNWIVTLEMTLFVFLLTLAVVLAVVLAVLTLLAPFIFFAYLFYAVGSMAGFWLIALLGLIVVVGLLLVSGSMLSVFQLASWSNLFLELVGAGATSKLVRLFYRTDNINKL